jgi:uncharacterized membrane protein
MYCSNLTGSPACGHKVTNMCYTYAHCYNLRGQAACGIDVTEMEYTYLNSYNITTANCGPFVTNMFGTYMNCYNLAGSAVCGNSVTNMYYAYSNCRNITEAVIGPNVNRAYYAYHNCVNVRGNVYINTNYMTNIKCCFKGRSNASKLNIYIPANTYSNTFNSIINYTNTMSIVGSNITWTQSGSYYYNTAFNIYVYPTL